MKFSKGISCWRILSNKQQKIFASSATWHSWQSIFSIVPKVAGLKPGLEYCQARKLPLCHSHHGGTLFQDNNMAWKCCTYAIITTKIGFILGVLLDFNKKWAARSYCLALFRSELFFYLPKPSRSAWEREERKKGHDLLRALWKIEQL